MSKICLIRQPAGIGDIFFTQKIAKDYISKGYLVIWPVIEQFEFIKDYIKIDGLTFVNENFNFPHKIRNLVFVKLLKYILNASKLCVSRTSVTLIFNALSNIIFAEEIAY